jgi:hypothetical protein
MAQQAKIIDVTRSYIPVDPNTFPQTMHATGNEDNPEERVPVIPYQGFNFLPTVYGYKSFFGLNSKFDADALTSNVDEIFVIQTETFRNILVALCDDGIWTKRGDVSGIWIPDITLSIPTAGQHKNWTYCVIANTLYCYRQGEASVWKLNTANSWVPTAFTPNFLNMTGQIGIFRAGARLGFWDSSDSVAWSNPDDTADFTPNAATMAGNTKFNGVMGRIVTIKPEDDGFIIYCTKSIVRVVRDFSSAYLWGSKTLIENAGISYHFEVAVGPNDSLHFALTSVGLYKIEGGQMENLIPGVVDYLKKSRQPIGLQFIQGRYLFFEILDVELIEGAVNFTTETIPEQTLTIQEAVSIYESFLIQESGGGGSRGILSAIQQHHDSIQVWRSSGGCFSGIGYCTNTDYPVFEDHISATIAPATLSALNANPETYFQFTGTGAAYSVVGPDGITNVPVLPTPLLPIPSAHKTQSFTEDNEQNFFSKQEEQWYGERRFTDLWLSKLKEIEDIRREATIVDAGTYPIGETIEEEYTFGPFLDLSFSGESNRIYGEYDIIDEDEEISTGWNGAFLHRSITQTFEIVITVKTETKEVL